jgi:hypothetical protein
MKKAIGVALRRVVQWFGEAYDDSVADERIATARDEAIEEIRAAARELKNGGIASLTAAQIDQSVREAVVRAMNPKTYEAAKDRFEYAAKSRAQIAMAQRSYDYGQAMQNTLAAKKREQ